MAQRAEPHDSLDDFPTPPWAGRALVEHLRRIAPGKTALKTVWEPACNRGSLMLGLVDSFGFSIGTDIFDYFPDEGPSESIDFLWPGSDEHIGEVDWIITNPPFRLAEQFIARAREVAQIGCAMLLRTSFIESEGRYERLFSAHPPTRILFFAERVVMLKGRLVRAGETDWQATEMARRSDPDAKERKASTATSYAWFIWIRGAEPMPPAWVPGGSRLRLERPGDYQGDV